MTRISLCMIVRDEEDCLARCLASTRGVVDEICVVDTGSTDRTREIAEQHGARVVSFEWKDDFAAARNASLELATGNWILVLDADEQIARPEAARAQLEQFAGQHPARAGHITLVDQSDTLDHGRRSALTRFFPRLRAPCFEGSIHEQLTLRGRTPSRAPTGVEVLHFGYADDVITRKSKLERNGRLLDAALERSGDDPYLLYQLGRNHARRDSTEQAIDAFSRAFEHVTRDAPFLADLILATAYCLRQLDQHDEAYELFSHLGVDFAEEPEMCFLGALLGMDVGHFELAETGFQRCLRLGESSAHGSAATTFGPAYNLGLLREHQDRPDEARRYYERALEYAPEHEPSREALQRLGEVA